MTRLLSGALFAASLLSACASAPKSTAYFLPDRVRETERAFAQTMANRDFAAFTRFLAEDAIFFEGDSATRGKQRVAQAWKPYFEGPQAPFSWEPSVVEVAASGNLALSSGPVRDASGKTIARFNTIWRLEAPGEWRVVFDKGTEVCSCEPRISTQAVIPAEPLPGPVELPQAIEPEALPEPAAAPLAAPPSGN